MVQKWRKKPVVIEAVQWLGNNQDEVLAFCNSREVCDYARIDSANKLEVITLEGVMNASVNDYIIKGVNGEFYPCKPDIFLKTYESAEISENGDKRITQFTN
jgi:hypothetical protein